MQTTKNIKFSNVAALLEKAVEIYKSEQEVNIIISPDLAEKVVELLENKYGFIHYCECIDILKADVEDAIKNKVPMMIGLLYDNEIITERFHKEYSSDAFMEGFYLIEQKYKSCLTSVSPYYYNLFQLEIF